MSADVGPRDDLRPWRMLQIVVALPWLAYVAFGLRVLFLRMQDGGRMGDWAPTWLAVAALVSLAASAMLGWKLRDRVPFRFDGETLR